MPRRSKKKKAGSSKGSLLFFGPLLALGLALAWIWKANKVKEYYSDMKALEESKKALLFEISQSRNQLADLKSLTTVDKIVTRGMNLTQKVSARIFLEDPVKFSPAGKRSDFVDMDDVTDWLESEAVRAGKVTAKENEDER